jgi:lipopolysaccharide/colanic/teichoic acid biosynthesis glycosyltransferase
MIYDYFFDGQNLGMTGVWQVGGRNDMSYEKRVYLDTWYVKNWSLWYDLVRYFLKPLESS